MTDKDIDAILDAIEGAYEHHEVWAKDYDYDTKTNEFHLKYFSCDESHRVDRWFSTKMV